MGSKPIWAIIFLALLNSGCSCFMTYAVENLTHYPLDEVDEFAEHQRNTVLGHAAWRQIEEACPGQPSSHDYKKGFIKGYADYLYYGGKGDPPAFPPWHYQTIHTQTPQGYLKAEDWFAGWRHGAEVAQQSGRRQFVPTPISIHYPPDLLAMSYADRINYLTLRAREASQGTSKETAPADVLPPPKVLDEPTPGFAAERVPGEPVLLQTGAAQTSAVGQPAAAASDRGLLNRMPPPARRGLLNNVTLPERDTRERGLLNQGLPAWETPERGLLNRRRSAGTPGKP